MAELVLTQSGLEKLKEELQHLLKVHIPEVKRRMTIAQQDGDLSENNPFITAREELEVTRFRVAELKLMIKTATILKKQDSDSINLGDTVITSINGKDMTFTVVSTLEADPVAKKISEESPLGKAVLGKKPGETAVLVTPNGNQDIKIISKK